MHTPFLIQKKSTQHSAGVSYAAKGACKTLDNKVIAGNRHFGFVLRICFALGILLCFGIKLPAQLSSKSQEVWPSVDAYLRLNQKWRLYATAAGTKMNESSYADGALGFFADYFTIPPGFIQQRFHNRADSLPGKFLWVRFGYQYSATPPSAEDPFKESMLVTEANGRFYLPWNMLLSAKNRFDWRIKNEDFNIRYRPRLTVERDMRTEYLTFTANAMLEYFFNFGNGQVDKLRTQFGVEVRVAKHINYEVFWNHQFAHQPEVQEVDAFGMTLKFYFDKKDFKKSWFEKPLFKKQKETSKEVKE